MLNNKIRKVVIKSGIVEQRFYIGDYEYYEKEEIKTETLKIQDDKQVVALLNKNLTSNVSNLTSIRYQLTNRLDSASLELNETGEIISYEEYHPFATTSYRSGRSEVEVSLKRYKYVFKELDNETGLYYYGMRYYAPWIARFIRVDPLAEARTWVSPYNYVQNNPISRIDPTGALDDTFIYDLNGNYVTTIKDDHDNEIVFVNKYLASSIKMLNTSLKWDNKALNKLGKDSRTLAYARYTKTTANKLSDYHQVASNNSSWGEPGGLLWINTKTRELHAWGVQGKGGNTFSLDDILSNEPRTPDGDSASPMSAYLKEGNTVGGEIFAIWHGHPGEGFESSDPTWKDDYWNRVKTIYGNSIFKSLRGGCAGVIVTRKASTIFPMYQSTVNSITFKPSFQSGYKGKESGAQWGVYNHKNLRLNTTWNK